MTAAEAVNVRFARAAVYAGFLSCDRSFLAAAGTIEPEHASPSLQG